MKEINLHWVAFWLCLAVILFGVTSCSKTLVTAPNMHTIDKSDYESCISKCPTNFNGEFKGLDCPKVCEQLIESKCVDPYREGKDIVIPTEEYNCSNYIDNTMCEYRGLPR